MEGGFEVGLVAFISGCIELVFNGTLVAFNGIFPSWQVVGLLNTYK